MGKKARNARKGRGLQVATLCISTAMVLVLLGMVVFIGLTANNLSDYVKENLTVTVMFRDDVSNREAAVVCRKLQSKPWVAHLEYIDRDRALKEQTKAMGTDPSEFLGENPFVPSAEINLKAGQANSDSLKWIAKQIKAYKQVSEVTYQKDLMDKVNSNLRKVMLVMLVIAVLLTLISFSLINNTVRLGIYERRFTINVMKLVGASWSFIRKPFLSIAVLEGLIAGALAILVLGGGIYALYAYEPDITAVVTWQVLTITAASVLLAGVIISVLCVYVSVTRFLNMPTERLYA
ncbi:MAG: permease-like cell division protein FtsX [Prevotella sp.]|nr:permease-like cell division protein FtsX [Prevotella sp.]MBR6192057.1 permease-like cell division protein FtsX [Prevotella sp.]